MFFILLMWLISLTDFPTWTPPCIPRVDPKLSWDLFNILIHLVCFYLVNEFSLWLWLSVCIWQNINTKHNGLFSIFPLGGGIMGIFFIKPLVLHFHYHKQCIWSMSSESKSNIYWALFHYMPNTEESILHALSHLIFMSTTWSRCHYSSYIIDEVSAEWRDL